MMNIPMNVFLNPTVKTQKSGLTRPAFQTPQFGVSLHPLTPLMNKLMTMIPSLDRPALQQVTDLLMAHQDYKGTLAGVFANGDMAIVTSREFDETREFAGMIRGLNETNAPQYRVYFGQPGRLKEFASTSALHMSSFADIRFAEPDFLVSTDSGFATGEISVVVNGQKAEQAIRL